MRFVHSIVGTLVIGCVSLALQACGGSGSGSGSGLAGTYASVGNENLTIAFKSGGGVEMAAAGLGSSSGTYTADGDKITVTIDNQNHIFLRDRNCVEDQRNMFGKLCKGGKAGEAANASAGSASAAPSGTYVATNADGEFKITFAPGNKLTLSVTPTVGNPETQEGTFVIEGSRMYVTLPQGVPMVLIYVNDTYESSAFGLPMKFVKQ